MAGFSRPFLTWRGRARMYSCSSVRRYVVHMHSSGFHWGGVPRCCGPGMRPSPISPGPSSGGGKYRERAAWRQACQSDRAGYPHIRRRRELAWGLGRPRMCLCMGMSAWPVPQKNQSRGPARPAEMLEAAERAWWMSRSPRAWEVSNTDSGGRGRPGARITDCRSHMAP
jgi:hypothetical protein